MEQELFKNRREASLLGAKISLMLMGVSMTLAICFTLVICLFIKTPIPFMGNAVLFSTYTFLATSIYAGSQGLSKMRNNGFVGRWDLSIPKEDFTYQTLFIVTSCLLYVLFLVVSL